MKSWISLLRNEYNDFDEFERYDSLWDLASRLGYSNPKDAWNENPLVGGSTNPEDYGIVSISDVARFCLDNYEHALLWINKLEFLEFEFDKNSRIRNVDDLMNFFNNVGMENIKRIFEYLYPYSFSEVMGYDFLLTRNYWEVGFFNNRNLSEDDRQFLTSIALRFPPIGVYYKDKTFYLSDYKP